MKLPEIIIYTDGSSRGNPGPGGWGTIIAWEGKVKELGGGENHTTNNRMELSAAIAGLSFVRDLGSAFAVDMRADSSYVINGITKWIAGWERNGWKNSKKEDVLNRDLWEALAMALSDVKMSGSKILWRYTPGHSGIPGNERADIIATDYADGKRPKLFSGARAEYDVDLESLEVTVVSTKSKKSPEEKARQKMKAYSYLSLVGGKLMRHTTWAECERRVKGVKGTKFKKAVSADDERAIIKEWGVR
ncbi:MAG: RNase H family protein [Patescibacteria group bacterium]